MGGDIPHLVSGYMLDEMCREARRCLDEAEAGGGYIIANTDAIPESANWEDIHQVVQTVKAYGKY
jgi:uroporphyrinogen-III decarboxylase